MGVTHFVDLTCDGESRCVPYTCDGTYMKFPIADHKVPRSKRCFASFILQLAGIIQRTGMGEKIYIHCKGGHGRSGVVVACLLVYLHNITPGEAMRLTTQYHGLRPMREKWKRMGSPQTRTQKSFVSKFFSTVLIRDRANTDTYIDRTRPTRVRLSTYLSTGFGSDALFPVTIQGVGTFPTARAAFYALNNPTCETYVNALESATSVDEVDAIFSASYRRADWSIIRMAGMKAVIRAKFEMHDVLMDALLDTGLSTIVVHDSDINMGKIMMELRNERYALVYGSV